MKKPSATPKLFSLLKKKISKAHLQKSSLKLRDPKDKTETDETNFIPLIDLRKTFWKPYEQEAKDSTFVPEKHRFLTSLNLNLRKKLKTVKYDSGGELLCYVYYTIAEIQSALDNQKMMGIDQKKYCEELFLLEKPHQKLIRTLGIFSPTLEYNNYIKNLREKIYQRKGKPYVYYLFLYTENFNQLDLIQSGKSEKLTNLLYGEEITEIALHTLRSPHQFHTSDPTEYLNQLASNVDCLVHNNRFAAKSAYKTELKTKEGMMLKSKLTYEGFVFKEGEKQQVLLLENISVSNEEVNQVLGKRDLERNKTIKSSNNFSDDEFQFLLHYYKDNIPLNAYKENVKKICKYREIGQDPKLGKIN